MAKSTPEKVVLYDHWTRRMEKDLTTIVEQEELDSVTGTFGFGVTTETDVKPLMSRSYTARSSQVWRKGPFTLFTQPVRNDLIHVGKELVRNEGVRFADIEQIWLNPSDRNRYGWTDSCRRGDEGNSEASKQEQ